MKQLRQFLKGTLFGVLAFGMVAALPMEVSAAARLHFNYKWPVCPNVITVRCDIPETGAVQSAMNSWNAVKDFSGRGMLTFRMTTSGSNSNYIHYINDVGRGDYIAYCDPTFIDPKTETEVKSIEIWLNKYGHSFSVGAKSGCYDVQSVVVHELGHALCVKHCHEKNASSCFSATCTSNVMNWSVPIGKTRRNLTSYDKSSYQVIYD